MPDLLSWGLLSLRSAKQAFRPSTRPRAHVRFPSLNAQLSTLEITCSFSTSGDSDGRLVCVVCAREAHMCGCLHSPLSGFCLAFELPAGVTFKLRRRRDLWQAQQTPGGRKFTCAAMAPSWWMGLIDFHFLCQRTFNSERWKTSLSSLMTPLIYSICIRINTVAPGTWKCFSNDKLPFQIYILCT